MEAWCLTAARWEQVKAAIDGRCEYEDCSELVSQFRLVKSDAELAYVRRAAELADDALARSPDGWPGRARRNRRCWRE